MTLTVGPATDYVVGRAQAAVAGITVGGHPVQVVDGEPATLSPAMFVVGVTDPPADGGIPETHLTREWQGLGALHIGDDFTIPCYIDVRVAGTNLKAARDQAEAIFNAFWPLIKASLTFGGILSLDAGIPDLIGQSGNTGTAAEPGRRYLIKFGIQCRNQTT